MEKFNLKKHWNKFENEELVVHCSTEKLAKEFLQYCNDKGITWSNGRSLIKDCNFDSYKEKTCYHYNKTYGMYFCSDTFYEKENMQIVKFSGFENTTETEVVTYELQPYTAISKPFFKLYLSSGIHLATPLEPSSNITMVVSPL